MTDLTTLTQQAAAAKAAWEAAGKPRGEHPLFVAAQEANKALVAAQREAGPAKPAVDASSALAAQAARQKAAADEAAFRRAMGLWRQADEWPRCGQDWPMDSAEREAERVIAAREAVGDGWSRVLGMPLTAEQQADIEAQRARIDALSKERAERDRQAKEARAKATAEREAREAARVARIRAERLRQEAVDAAAEPVTFAAPLIYRKGWYVQTPAGALVEVCMRGYGLPGVDMQRGRKVVVTMKGSKVLSITQEKK